MSRFGFGVRGYNLRHRIVDGHLRLEIFILMMHASNLKSRVLPEPLLKQDIHLRFDNYLPIYFRKSICHHHLALIPHNCCQLLESYIRSVRYKIMLSLKLNAFSFNWSYPSFL